MFLMSHLEEEIEKCENYKEMKLSENKNLILTELERLVSNKLYKYVFPEQESEDDQILYVICECFNWVNFEHLEINKIARNYQLADLAIQNLLAIG